MLSLIYVEQVLVGLPHPYLPSHVGRWRAAMSVYTVLNLVFFPSPKRPRGVSRKRAEYRAGRFIAWNGY
jgi:4'-phosphopantetheinyl transferase EntD